MRLCPIVRDAHSRTTANTNEWVELAHYRKPDSEVSAMSTSLSRDKHPVRTGENRGGPATLFSRPCRSIS